ncbi:MAG: peptidoglycan DD-metalloendopeptidase family protein [Candidatus Thiodiazotropha sp. (ex Dulcina madagascariensis)]|nr:peptidoglycan DD-metalloendopeptidase family protein [Candidatus Thiodiazotropha sp. (ex Dulcina madagascariensis)]MCU7926639.1 peptidoglycan DD-metalloendopeptidase family protein [Candidatus Thiodiazotropha sp. (ex Dulcina madagascariensis)]
MQDFKSYTLERRPARGQLAKRLVIAAVFLVILAAGFLFLISEPDAPPQEPPLPTPEAEDSQQKKLILPLSLPGQTDTGESHKPPTAPARSIGFIKQAVAVEQEPATPTVADTPPLPETDNTHLLTYKVRSGDSLATIFKKHDLSANLLHRIVHSSDTAGKLVDIRPGEMLYLTLDKENNLLNLRLEQSKIHSLEISALDDSFKAEEISREVEPRTTHVSGVIENSLYLAAKEAGLSEKLIMQLAEIFGWDIDFALEIRAGDRFTVIFQEDYLDGEKLRDGPILAAEFINRGRSYRALRYIDAAGRSDYYTPEGRSMRKAFLRAPVDFRRISSKFTRERWHPVLGKKRPHRGVDYAAKTGTPIKAAGDGKIIHRGVKGGYGKAVIIQHGQVYTTLYAHLSRYNKKAKKGQRVQQGQIIGYVGRTGLATGPHLHYEFRVNGVYRNPLTVKLPAAKPIAKKYLADFQTVVQPLLTQLELISRTMVADAK